MFDFFKSAYSSFQSIYSYFFTTPFKIFVEYDQDARTFHLRFSGKDAHFHREHLIKIIRIFMDISVQKGLEEDKKKGIEVAARIKKIQKMEHKIASRTTEELTRWKHPEVFEKVSSLKKLNKQLGKEQSTYPLHDVSDVQKRVFELLKKKKIEVQTLTVDNKLERVPDIFEETYLANLSEDSLLPRFLQPIWHDSVVQNHRGEVLMDQIFLRPYLRPRNTIKNITEWVQKLESENEECSLDKLEDKIKTIAPEAFYKLFDWPKELEDEVSYICSEGHTLCIKSERTFQGSGEKSTVLIIPLTKLDISDDISIGRTSTSIECFEALSKNGDELLWYLMAFNLRMPVTKAFENLQVRKENPCRSIAKEPPNNFKIPDGFEKEHWMQVVNLRDSIFFIAGKEETEKDRLEQFDALCGRTHRLTYLLFSPWEVPIRSTETNDGISCQFKRHEGGFHFLELLDWLELIDLETKKRLEHKILSEITVPREPFLFEGKFEEGHKEIFFSPK